MGAVDVSVVVCTYNRAELLRDTLASLKAQETGDGFRYDVVIVDNGSTDDTPRVIEEASGSSAAVVLRGVREPKPGVAAARNRGIRESSGEWVAFFDDDQVAEPSWLREMLTFARERGVHCVGGSNRLLLATGGEPEKLPPVCRAMLGEMLERTPYRYTGKRAPGAGNLLLHRSVFEAAGVFDEGLREAGEDTDLFRRITAAGIEGWYCPHGVGYHVVPGYRLSASYLRWKARLHGSHLARRNLRQWGRGLFVLELLARLGQALGLHLPRLLWAGLGRDEDRLLGARCRVWRSEGYIRSALRLLAPRLFPQQRFFAQLEFRAEREIFAHT
jgi:glycosyltransferase involved in cell wall biosynthesis